MNDRAVFVNKQSSGTSPRPISYGFPKSANRRALECFQGLLGHTSAPTWYARSRSLSGAVILMYHSIADKPDSRWIDPRNHIAPSVFRKHLSFLAAHRNVISLAELLDRLGDGAPIRRGTVVLTFDDGYLDNLERAFPLLAEFKMPATVFLPTRYIDEAEDQWIDRLYSAFRTRTAHELCVELRENALEVVLDTHRSCMHAYRELSGYLLEASYAERQRILVRIGEQLKPSAKSPKLTMGWEDVRRAAAEYSGVDFGSHTVSHLDVTSHDDETVYQELSDSKTRIHTMLDRPARFFSFPYNRVSPTAMRMLQPLGYEAAVADGNDIRVGNGAERYWLPRLEAPAMLGRLSFVTSGAYPDLSQRLLGRA